MTTPKQPQNTHEDATVTPAYNTSIEDPNAEDNQLTRKQQWIIIAVIVALIAAIGVLIWKPWDSETDIENQVSVAPERSWNVDANSQQYLPEANIIAGKGKGTMTFPDNEQNGEPVSFKIVEVDTTDNGNGNSLIPPQEIDLIGHYVRTPKAGAEKPRGSAVYTSHVNYNGAVGVGSIWTSLKQGDPITFTDNDGNEHHYTVDGDPFRISKTSPDYVERTAQTVNDMESTDGKVVLVSCGGEFVGGALGYADNVIVVAHPVKRVEQ